MDEKIYFPEAATATNIKELLLELYPGDSTSYQDPNGYVFTWEKSLLTYKDPEHTEVECKPANRSFAALLIICRTYFPETTERQLAITLKELVDEGVMRGLYCHNISRIVFFRGEQRNFIATHLMQLYAHTVGDLDMYTAEYITNLLTAE